MSEPAAAALPATPSRHPLFAAFCEAAATLLAALATLLCAHTIDPAPGTAVLTVVLSLSLARSQLDRDLRGRLEAAWALPLVGLAAAGVAVLLHRLPWVGAFAFTSGIASSIWLRRFGPAAHRAGALIALPLVAILTTPYLPPSPATKLPALLVPIVVALLALFWVGLSHALFRALRWLPPPKAAPAAAPAQRASALRPSATTRMALQMAAALAAAFAVGHLCFGAHGSWVVLTAFIVNSANRGRLDVAHKSLLRVLGAAAGTLAAALVPAHLFAHDATTVALVLAALFVGTWLRPLGYTWWALFVTLALALLQDWLGMPAERALWLRLGGIVAGALIGVAAAWFVLPVESGGVLRRRIADALAALSAALDPANPERDPQAFAHAMAAVEQLAPAFRSGRLIARGLRRDFAAAGWIEQLRACRDDAMRLIDGGQAPVAVRRALGAARKALLEPATLADALRELRRVLEATRPVPAETAATTLPTAD